MFKNLLIITVSLSLMFYASSCEPENFPFDEDELGYAYYPLKTGNTWEYQMDSIIYDNDGLTVTSSSSFYRECLKSFFVEGGDTIFNVEVSRKTNWEDEYKLNDVWVIQKDSEALRKIEENLTFVKLRFPYSKGANWDGIEFPDTTVVFIAGDAIMMFENWNFSYDSLLVDKTVSEDLFSDVIQVTQADNENFLKRRFSQEFYAKGVGLIERRLEIYDTQCTEPGCETISWEDKTEQGFSLTQTLVDHY